MRKLAYLLALLTLVATFQPARAQGSAPQVLWLTANGAVAQPMKEYIQRGLGMAAQRNVDLVVIELDTPGGMISTMTDIVESIRTSRVPVVVYISPRGAMAGSAGTLITLAGHAAAMAPETIIGAASPVGSGGEDLNETIKAKEMEALTAQVRALAARRPAAAITLAQETITNARAVSANEALEIGLVDFIASDRTDLLRQLDGFVVELPDGPVTLETEWAEVQEAPMSFIEQVLDILVNPNFVFLLLSIGVQAILIELSSPGGWFAGFVGVVALALAAYGLGALPVNWFGIIFMVTAFVLFVLELKTPTAGGLTAAGVGSFIVGALILFNSPGVPQFQRVSIPLIVGVGVAVGLSFAVIVGFALKAQKVPIHMGVASIVGKRGTARGRVAPHGQVQVLSEVWSAELAEGADSIESGEAVEVMAVEGLRLKVRRA